MQPEMISCIPEEDYELAAQYAAELARDPTNAYGIAMRLTFGDFSKANMMATTWRGDAVFQKAVREAQSEMTKFDMMKTKDDFILEVQTKMSELNGKLWIETAKFYAELRGFIEKDGGGQTFIQNVIQVPAEVPLDEWERRAAASQAKLQSEAKLINDNTAVKEKV